MNTLVNPDMLTLAREIRGMTQSDLSQHSGINQSKISKYEGGVAVIDQSDLEVMSSALRFPIDFFSQQGRRFGAEPTEIFHRKRRTVSAKDRKRIDALMDLHRFGSERLLESFELGAKFSVPSLPVAEFESIGDIADMVRAVWRMPGGPIINLIGWLEQASCLVFEYDFNTDKIDEAVQWIDPAPPVVLVNSCAPADRLRFSLAHALGHLVMHRDTIPYPRMEEEADRFAAAFLMPSQNIREELLPVTIQHMLELKERWHVSMQALIVRAKDLEAITHRRYTSLFQQLSRLGYRKNEPFPILREKPRSVKMLLDAYKEQLAYTDEELAQLLRIRVQDFYKWYYPYNKVITLDQNKSPGEIADKPGEYRERGPRGGNVRNPRDVTIVFGDRIPPTQKPNRKWERIDPRKRGRK